MEGWINLYDAGVYRPLKKNYIGYWGVRSLRVQQPPPPPPPQQQPQPTTKNHNHNNNNRHTRFQSSQRIPISIFMTWSRNGWATRNRNSFKEDAETNGWNSKNWWLVDVFFCSSHSSRWLTVQWAWMVESTDSPNQDIQGKHVVRFFGNRVFLETTRLIRVSFNICAVQVETK